MLKDRKNDIILQIMELRTLIAKIETSENEDEVMDIQRQINKIHDMVFGL